jgi:hypothetical protein
MLQKIKDFLTTIVLRLLAKFIENVPDNTYPNKPSVISTNNSEGFEPKVKTERPVIRRDRTEFTE